MTIAISLEIAGRMFLPLFPSWILTISFDLTLVAIYPGIYNIWVYKENKDNNANKSLSALKVPFIIYIWVYYHNIVLTYYL